MAPPAAATAARGESSRQGTPSRLYPKRKRKPVSYAEPGSEDEGFYSQTEDDADAPAKKKPKPRAPRALPKKKIFPFALLPAEIRNQIYSHALSDPHGIHLHTRTLKYRHVVKRCAGATRRLVPALLLANRAIYAEAASFLYSQPITLFDARATQNFLAQIGARGRGLLRNVCVENLVSVRGKRHLNFDMMNSLARCEGLVAVKFGRGITWRGGPNLHGRLAVQVYRDALYWIEEAWKRTGDPYAALRMIELGPDNFGRFEDKLSDEEEEQHRANMKLFREKLKELIDERR